MVLLNNDKFLVELAGLFYRARTLGSITLCIKRYNGQDRHVPRNGSKPFPEPEQLMCLIRVKHKKKIISTVVHAEEVDKFQQAYCSLLRSNMDGLKKIKKLKSKPKAHQ